MQFPFGFAAATYDGVVGIPQDIPPSLGRVKGIRFPGHLFLETKKDLEGGGVFLYKGKTT